MATATRKKARRRRISLPTRRKVTLPEPVTAFWELVRRFGDRGLLIYAGALAFQVLTAIVPFLLFCIGLLGFFDLKHVWTNDVATSIEPHVSAAAFTVIDQTVTQVLTQKQVFWVTAGFALAVWQLSGGVRVIMRGLDVIYETEDERSWPRRVVASLLLALLVGALVIASIAVVWAGPLVYGDAHGVIGALLFLVRWGLAAFLLGLATGATMRLAPDSPQPPGWVSFGTALTVGAWIVASILFGLYIRYVASYGSVFGNLASIVIAIAYIYISTTVFFGGVQFDAIIRERVEGNPRGR